jgi:hypothetical protein
MDRKRTMTAVEHNTILSLDPSYHELIKAQDEEIDRKAEILRADAEPVINELRSLGLHLNTLWDLVNSRLRHPKDLLVLIRHIDLPYRDENLEAIARALAVPYARPMWKEIKERYQRAAPDSGLKDGLAVALAAISDGSTLEDLHDIIRDPSNGESRVLLLHGLRKLRSPIARLALVELSSDPVLAEEISSWCRSAKLERSTRKV